MTGERRVYKPRLVGGKVMLPADLKRLHKYMLDIKHIDHISDEMRAVVESEWPELAHKLPPPRPPFLEPAVIPPSSRSAATAQAKRLADRAHQAQGRGRPRAFQLLQDLRHAESG